MASNESLKVRANQIKNEVNEGRNTANRVGGLLVDMVEKIIYHEVAESLSVIL